MTIAARIRTDIEARIASGRWLPGHRVPTENELVSQYRCARATVGKALVELVRAGLIERRRKAGTFVARPQIHSAVLDIPDIGQAIRERTGDYRFELLFSQTRTDDGRSGSFIARTAVRHVTGIHRGRDGPYAYEDRLISLEAVPEARRADFSRQSPGQWLLQTIPWTQAHHRISAVGASARISGHLCISRRAPCLRLERWTWRAGQPVTFVSQTFRGDRFDLMASFTPQGR